MQPRRSLVWDIGTNCSGPFRWQALRWLRGRCSSLQSLNLPILVESMQDAVYLSPALPGSESPCFL